MLVLTRKQDESIKMGWNIVVKVMKMKNGSVKIGIEAPSNVRVLRGELATFEQPSADDVFVQYGDETMEECLLEALMVQS